MVANFSTTWSDDYVILSDLLFIIYVDMSDHYVGMSEKDITTSSLIYFLLCV